jgi:citrate lyase subunit beta/citryl-CoA lyase
MTLQPITYLFVPGDRPDRFDKALAAGADAVILDLEDAVLPPGKDDARKHVRAWVDAHSDAADRVVVRINADSTPWFDDDLALLRACGVATAMVPKVETSAQASRVRSALPAHGRVLPMIETARGVQGAEAIAGTSGVARLVFGTLDLCVDLDLSGDPRGLMYPAARIVLASRCADIASPVAGVTPDIHDTERLRADLAFDRAFGFGAKLCIHPRQVAVVREAMQPSAAEIDWARRVLAAVEGGRGAVQVDGRMVDRPVVLRAQAILARAAPT